MVKKEMVHYGLSALKKKYFLCSHLEAPTVVRLLCFENPPGCWWLCLTMQGNRQRLGPQDQLPPLWLPLCLQLRLQLLLPPPQLCCFLLWRTKTKCIISKPRRSQQSRPIKIKISRSVKINFWNLSRLSLLLRQDYFLSRPIFLKSRFLSRLLRQIEIVEICQDFLRFIKKSQN